MSQLLSVFHLKENLTEQEREEVMNEVNCTAPIDFESERFWLAIEWLFAIKHNQRLIGLTYSEDGVRAIIKRKEKAKF